MIKIVDSTNRRAVKALLSPERVRDAATEKRVATIVSDVRRNGDAALTKYARALDRLDGPLEVSLDDMRAAARQVPAHVRAAIRAAAKNIRIVARRQVPTGWRARVAPGVTVEQRIVPLDRVGCYVPAGRYPLPSSLLMTAIPADAAGVAEVVAVCPRPAPVVMAAALEAGVSRLFRVGGAHAVAALAYGTGSVRRVDKIVGPGNAWVTAAKREVAGDVAIDGLAGPTEVLIVADASADPDLVAADLLAQAEHDPRAAALLATPDERLAKAVRKTLAEQVEVLATAATARASLAAFGTAFVVAGMGEALTLIEALAPEHLQLVGAEAEALAGEVRSAGAVFVGAASGEVFGDYVAGPSHVLPTGGSARFASALGVEDFVRRSHVVRFTRQAAAEHAAAAAVLADAEGLPGHAAAARRRLA
jgi:histidinol dehydrogenase